jgi:hypothetical protein
MSTTTVYIATSLAGYIAPADAGLDWLNRRRKNHLNGSGTVGGAGPTANSGIIRRPHYDSVFSGVIPRR